MSDVDAADRAVAAARAGSRSPFAPVGADELRAAVWSPIDAAPRSDFDLNPSARALLEGPRALRPASVLCGVVERPDGLHAILTRRAEHLNRHAGQVAFPGGKVDAADPSPLSAALREADEEIGLPRELVDVLGAIDPYETSTGFQVTPFVALVDPRFQPIVDPNEVAAVFEAPLSRLLDPAQRRVETRLWRGVERAYYAMTHGEHRIWGATAGMLKGLSDRLIAVRGR